MIVPITLEDARQLGELRQSGHPNVSDRLYGYKAMEHVIGVQGEMAFEQVSGLPMDRRRRPLGDNGIDFTLDIGVCKYTIDVKTARYPKNLLVKANEIGRGPNFYVLARSEPTQVKLLGWAHREVVADAPTADFGIGKQSHYIHFSRLRPIEDLLKLLSTLNCPPSVGTWEGPF